ncbi:secretion system protein, partial [Bifidobacterium adolescentis]
MKKQKIVAGDRLPSKKMSLNHQAKYIRLMGELLDHGF